VRDYFSRATNRVSPERLCVMALHTVRAEPFDKLRANGICQEALDSIQSRSMRLLVRHNTTHLHGYIAGSDGEVDWSFIESGDQKQEPPRVDFLNSLLGG
jgi:hypothetical protein